jgi:hypothetical protein
MGAPAARRLWLFAATFAAVLLSLPRPAEAFTETYGSLSYGLPAANVTANSIYDTNTPDKVIDGNLDVGWVANCCIPVIGDSTSYKWITIDLGAIKAVQGVDLVVAQSPGGVSRHSVQYSNDGNTFTEVDLIERSMTTDDLLSTRVSFSASSTKSVGRFRLG